MSKQNWGKGGLQQYIPTRPSYQNFTLSTSGNDNHVTYTICLPEVCMSVVRNLRLKNLPQSVKANTWALADVFFPVCLRHFPGKQQHWTEAQKTWTWSFQEMLCVPMKIICLPGMSHLCVSVLCQCLCPYCMGRWRIQAQMGENETSDTWLFQLSCPLQAPKEHSTSLEWDASVWLADVSMWLVQADVVYRFLLNCFKVLTKP